MNVVDTYCQEKTARSGSSFYYSFLFLPAAEREAITALYAFCREVDDVVDDCSDRNIAQRKLDWWRQEIAEIFHGNPQHPVGKALALHLRTKPQAQAWLLEIVAGMEMDLTFQGYATMADLEVYCHKVAGVVGMLAALLFGFQNPATLEYAQKLGLAFQMTNIIRDVREDVFRGRIYLPKEDLDQFHLSYADIEQLQNNDAFNRLLQFEVARAKTCYQTALSMLPEEDRYAQRVGLMMAAIYQTLLAEIETDPLQVLQGRVKLAPLRKLWIAWRTARQEKKRFDQQQQ